MASDADARRCPIPATELRTFIKLRSLRGQVLKAVATEGALTSGEFISGVW